MDVNESVITETQMSDDESGEVSQKKSSKGKKKKFKSK